MTPTAPRRRACPLKISPIIAVSARPLSRYDQNVAFSDMVDSQENGPKVGRLAQDRDRAPEQARLPSGRPKRPDRGVNLSLGAPHIDRDGDGDIAPAFDLSVGQIARGDRVDSNSQGSFPLFKRRAGAMEARLGQFDQPSLWVKPSPRSSSLSPGAMSLRSSAKARLALKESEL